MSGHEVVLGVTGGIAAYKAADLCSKLMQAGMQVTVVMTPAAEKFIGKTTFEALTGRPVYRDLFTPQEHPLGEHIGFSRRADLMVIAPATANFLAKAAHGFADDLLSTLLLAATCPVLFAPAMNTDMWNKSATQRNIQQLRDDGYHFTDPGSGWLSCRQTGPGRMAEPTDILEAIRQLLNASDS